MTSDFVSNTNAVFTSDQFDRTWHPEGGDCHPPPGRDLAIALGDALAEAGFTVSQMKREIDDPRTLWWEHSYWYLYFTADGNRYFVQIEPIDRFDLWRVAFSRAGGWTSLFRSHQSTLTMPSSLQQRVETIIQSLARCDDLRWVTEDEAIRLW